MTRNSIHRLVGMAAALLALPAFAGCAIESLDPSGNGRQVIEEGIRIENATIVAGDKDSGKAAFLGTVFNTSEDEEAIVSITAGGVEAALKPSPAEIPVQESISIQTGRDVTADFENLTANEGTYVPVKITFKNAGEADFQALIVPPAGYYASAAPAGTAERQATPEDAVTDEESGHSGASESGEPTPDGASNEDSDGASTEESDASALEGQNS